MVKLDTPNIQIKVRVFNEIIYLCSQSISHNLSSAEKLKVEAEATYNKMTNLYGYHMNKLTTSQQEVVESNLEVTDASVDRVALTMFQPEQCLLDINKRQRRISAAIFRTDHLQEKYTIFQ